MPQVYAIASQRGLEVGFAASIPEDDYFNLASKARNKSIVPFINSKLPSPDDALVHSLAQDLFAQGGWHFNEKTRLTPADSGFDSFNSLASFLSHLQDGGDVKGGGIVSRYFPFQQVGTVSVLDELEGALANFAPFLARCAPTPWDIEVRNGQESVEKEAENIQSFDPTSEQEGRRKVLAEVARRQGQQKFRQDLIDAYDGCCAISGTKVSDVLQAAHISPYNGPSTNHVTNGLLLRADLHTLFDLKLITVNPTSMTVTVSSRLKSTTYWTFNGCKLKKTAKESQAPSPAAVKAHFGLATSTSLED